MGLVQSTYPTYILINPEGLNDMPALLFSIFSFVGSVASGLTYGLRTLVKYVCNKNSNIIEYLPQPSQSAMYSNVLLASLCLMSSFTKNSFYTHIVYSGFIGGVANAIYNNEIRHPKKIIRSMLRSSVFVSTIAVGILLYNFKGASFNSSGKVLILLNGHMKDVIEDYNKTCKAYYDKF